MKRTNLSTNRPGSSGRAFIARKCKRELGPFLFNAPNATVVVAALIVVVTRLTRALSCGDGHSQIWAQTDDENEKHGQQLVAYWQIAMICQIRLASHSVATLVVALFIAISLTVCLPVCRFLSTSPRKKCSSRAAGHFPNLMMAISLLAPD